MNIVTLQLSQPEVIKEFVAYASYETEPKTNNKAVAVNLDVTKQELDSLFSTNRYERPYQPEYYNPLEELLGELYTDQSEALAIHLVTEKVERFIPRISIDPKTSFTFDNYKLTMNLIFYYKLDYSKTLYDYERKFNVVS